VLRLPLTPEALTPEAYGIRLSGATVYIDVKRLQRANSWQYRKRERRKAFAYLLKIGYEYE